MGGEGSGRGDISHKEVEKRRGQAGTLRDTRATNSIRGLGRMEATKSLVSTEIRTEPPFYVIMEGGVEDLSKKNSVINRVKRFGEV